MKNQHGEKYKEKAVYKALLELDKLELVATKYEPLGGKGRPKKKLALNDKFFGVYNIRDDILEQSTRVKANIANVFKACAAGVEVERQQTDTGKAIKITWPDPKKNIMKSRIVKEFGGPPVTALVETARIETAPASCEKCYTMKEVLSETRYEFAKSTFYNARKTIEEYEIKIVDKDKNGNIQRELVRGLVNEEKNRNRRRGPNPKVQKFNKIFDLLYRVLEYPVSYDMGLEMVTQEEARKRLDDKELDQQ